MLRTCLVNSLRIRSARSLRLARSARFSIFEGEETRRRGESVSAIFDVYKEHPKRQKLPQAQVDKLLKDKEIVASEPVCPETSFKTLGVSENVRKNLETSFDKPTLIQQITLPIGLSGRDLVGLAQTGSGKTLSFALPLIEHVLANKKNHKTCHPIALVIEPTRELAMQVFKEISALGELVGVRGAQLYGGSNVSQQSHAMQQNSDFVVGTPGRLLDFGERGYVDFSRTSFVVMDEADRMLDMGFKRELSGIIGMTPQKRQLTMWSATWNGRLSDVAASYINNPFMVKVGTGDVTVNPDIKQEFALVAELYKPEKFSEMVMRTENRSKTFLVFVNRKATCGFLVNKLRSSNIEAVEMNGDLNQYQRERNLDLFRSRSVKVLVATDVAARGIDIKNIDYVVNYDFPRDIEHYVHRIGRTGRAGKKGTSVSFLTRADSGLVPLVKDILGRVGQEVPEELEQLSGHSGYSGNSRDY